MKHLRFFILVFREHYQQFFEEGKFGGIFRITFETFLYGIVGYLFNQAEVKFDSDAIGALLSAVSLFASLLLAVLVLLHGQINKYTTKTDFNIDQTDSDTFPKSFKVGMNTLLVDAKIHTTRSLFNDISICLLLSILSSFLMVLALMVKGHWSESWVNLAFVIIGMKMMLVIYEFCRKLYYLLNDDFSKGAA